MNTAACGKKMDLAVTNALSPFLSMNFIQRRKVVVYCIYPPCTSSLYCLKISPIRIQRQLPCCKIAKSEVLDILSSAAVARSFVVAGSVKSVPWNGSAV